MPEFNRKQQALFEAVAYHLSDPMNATLLSDMIRTAIRTTKSGEGLSFSQVDAVVNRAVAEEYVKRADPGA